MESEERREEEGSVAAKGYLGGHGQGQIDIGYGLLMTEGICAFEYALLTQEYTITE